MPNFASTWLKVALSAGGQLLLSSLWSPPATKTLSCKPTTRIQGVSECTLEEMYAGSAVYESHCKGGVRCSDQLTAHLRE